MWGDFQDQNVCPLVLAPHLKIQGITQKPPENSMKEKLYLSLLPYKTKKRQDINLEMLPKHYPSINK